MCNLRFSLGPLPPLLQTSEAFFPAPLFSRFVLSRAMTCTCPRSPRFFLCFLGPVSELRKATLSRPFSLPLVRIATLSFFRFADCYPDLSLNVPLFSTPDIAEPFELMTPFLRRSCGSKTRAWIPGALSHVLFLDSAALLVGVLPFHPWFLFSFPPPCRLRMGFVQSVPPQILFLGKETFTRPNRSPAHPRFLRLFYSFWSFISLSLVFGGFPLSFLSSPLLSDAFVFFSFHRTASERY